MPALPGDISMSSFPRTARGSTCSRFELFDVSVDSSPLQFEEAGAYLLGTDVAALAAPKTRGVIQEFLAGLTDEYSRPIGQVLTEEKRTGNDERRAEVWRLFRVFRGGFERR